MELIKHVNAYMALNTLLKEKYTYKDAYAIVKLKNVLKENFEFFRDKEREIVSRTAKENSVKGTYFEFADVKAKEEYEKEMLELSILDVEAIEKITLSPPERITPETLEALADFVIFKEVNDEGAS